MEVCVCERPVQLSVHSRLLGSHMAALGPLLDEVIEAGNAAVKECAADKVYNAVAGEV